jgi:esterase
VSDVASRRDSGGNDRQVKLRGLSFHYREWPSGGPTLLLLHGLCSHAHTFDRVAQALADRYRVVALDQRGHGETDWAASYSWPEWVEDIDALRKHLGVDRLTLLGHSSGGWFAYLYAGLHPSAVERLLVAEAAPLDVSAPPPARAAAGDAFYGSAGFSSVEEAIELARSTGTRATELELRERTIHNLKMTADGRWIFRYDPRVLEARDRAELRPPPEEEWRIAAGINCPTLVLRGGASSFTTSDLARQRTERLCALLADCHIVTVPEAGHGLWMDQPDVTIEAIRGFLP